MTTRILMLLTSAPGSGGGISRYDSDLLSALSRIEEIEVEVIYPKHGALWRSRFALASIAKGIGYQPDWVFCGHIQFSAIAWIVSWMCLLRATR